MFNDTNSRSVFALCVAIGLSALTVTVVVCSLFRYQVLANANGGPTTRYDRWTSNVEFLIANCRSRGSAAGFHWGQPADPDAPWCNGSSQ